VNKNMEYAMNHRKRRKGGSVLEGALFLPWFIFLFIGAFDWGFYAHALISTENAARVAALYTSTSSTTADDSATACSYALAQLKTAPNIGSLSTCQNLPLIVTAAKVTGPDGQWASEVVITYRTTQLIPIPGLLMGQATIRRVCQMALRS
jgi:Flp pilus assembly protein TadG